MKKLNLFFLALIIFLSACSPALRHVELTDAGAKVIYLGSNVPESIPGRPLDRCKTIQYMIIRDQFEHGCLGEDDMVNALRNRAAAHGGNVAVLSIFLRDIKAYEGSVIACDTAVNGFALLCDRDTLQAAGLTGIIETPINSDWVVTLEPEGSSGRERLGRQNQSEPDVQSRKGDRKRAAEN